MTRLLFNGYNVVLACIVITVCLKKKALNTIKRFHFDVHDVRSLTTYFEERMFFQNE